MKKKLINKERNEWKFELSEQEVVHRIFKILETTNKNLKESDIHRHKNSKEYRANFIDEYGKPVSMAIGIGNLKRYFGSRLIELNDETGGMYVRRVLPS